MVLVDIMTAGNPVPTIPVGRFVEMGIVLVVCLIPGFFRFERPVPMITCSLVLLFLDMLATASGYLLADIQLPMASPVVGIFGSTAVLGMMAWNEERMRRAKMEDLVRARVQFTDMLVHDLKKRISSVIVSLSLLENRVPHGKDENDLMEVMKTSIGQMLLEVNNLLDIRKIEECGMRLNCEVINLAKTLGEMIDEHKSAAQIAGVSIRLEGDNRTEARADHHILSRIMTNLLWNAIQHAPPASEILVSFAMADGSATVSVSNRGESIPAYRQKSMFDAFHSDDLDFSNHHSDGTGLGLAFCKLAVEAHGGTIKVESPWSGSSDGVRVVISLPFNGVLQSRTAV